MPSTTCRQRALKNDLGSQSKRASKQPAQNLDWLSLAAYIRDRVSKPRMIQLHLHSKMPINGAEGTADQGGGNLGCPGFGCQGYTYLSAQRENSVSLTVDEGGRRGVEGESGEVDCCDNDSVSGTGSQSDRVAHLERCIDEGGCLESGRQGDGNRCAVG